jgi:hypothetical protein
VEGDGLVPKLSPEGDGAPDFCPCLIPISRKDKELPATSRNELDEDAGLGVVVGAGFGVGDGSVVGAGLVVGDGLVVGAGLIVGAGVGTGSGIGVGMFVQTVSG